MVIKLRFSSFSRCSLIQREPTTYEKPAIPFQELFANIRQVTRLESPISLLECWRLISPVMFQVKFHIR